MASPSGTGATLPPVRHLPPQGIRRVLIQSLTVMVFVVIGLAGTLWWEERPVRQAASRLNAKDTIGAIEALRPFLSANPGHERALALKARILVEQGQPQSAIDIFERVGASRPEEMHAWAKALLQQEKWSLALPLLEFVEKKGIDKADVLHELAACRVKIGDFDNALKSAEEFALQPGFNTRGELLKGTIHHERGNLRLTAASWAAVLKMSPDGLDLQIPPEEFFLEYGRVLLALGEPALAETLLRRSLSLKEDPAVQVSLGDALFQLGKITESRVLFESAIQGDPYSVPARKGLATLLLSEGKAQQAVELLLPLERSDIISSEIAFLLQRSYVRLGDEASATRWREKADLLRREETVQAAADQILRDTPDSHWATVIRAYKFARVGNWSEAEAILGTLDEESQSQPFIRDLVNSVKLQGELPSLLGLPVRDL